MSNASITRTIKFVAKGATYTAALVAPKGDIYQEYSEESGDISPDFAKTTPYLQFVCISSRVVEGIVDLSEVKVYFNGVQITFNDSGVSNNSGYVGYFQLLAPSATSDYWTLVIVRSLVKIAGYASATIKMTGKVAYGTQSDEVQAEYHIKIQPSTGETTRVTIMAGDNKNFVIADKRSSCKLKAVTYVGENSLLSDVTYTWYKMTVDGWTAITSSDTGLTVSDTGNCILTVDESAIDTYGEFRVVATKDGNVIGSDIQGVMDATDAYEIEPNPTPTDETITESSGGKVTYAPQIIDRKANTYLDDSYVIYKFTAMDVCGNILGTGNDQTFAVTEEMCDQAGGDVALNIIATITD